MSLSHAHAYYSVEKALTRRIMNNRVLMSMILM